MDRFSDRPTTWETPEPDEDALADWADRERDKELDGTETTTTEQTQ